MLAGEFRFWAADKWQFSPACIDFLAEERIQPIKIKSCNRRSKVQAMLDHIKSAYAAGKKKKFSMNDHKLAFIRTPELNAAIRQAVLSLNMQVLLSPMENDYQAAQELQWGKYTIYICHDSDALLYEYLHTVLFMTSPVKGEAFLWNRSNALDFCRKSKLLSVEARVDKASAPDTPVVDNHNVHVDKPQTKHL